MDQAIIITSLWIHWPGSSKTQREHITVTFSASHVGFTGTGSNNENEAHQTRCCLYMSESALESRLHVPLIATEIDSSQVEDSQSQCW